MSASSDPASQAVLELCQRVADGLEAAGDCPCCSSVLGVAVSIHGVSVSCPDGCFRFDFRRNLQGGFVSGSLDFPRQESAAPTRAAW